MEQPPSDLIPTFRDFVTNEKQRLTQKRQAIVKNEMDKRMSELIKFGRDFKVRSAIRSYSITSAQTSDRFYS